MATDYASDLLEQKAGSKGQTDYASEIISTPATEQKPYPIPESEDFIHYEALKQTGADIPEHFMRAVRGFAQGAGDLPIGLVQLLSKFAPENAEQAVSEYIKQREAEYQASRGDYADRADIGRVTGTVVASMPLGGKTAAVTLPGRMAQGAKIGAAMGAAQIVDPDNENYWLGKGVQVAGGAVTGALAVPIVEGLVKAGGAAVNSVAKFIKGLPNRLSNKATQQTIEQTLTLELKKQGMNWGDLPKQMRDAMVLETQKALKSGGKIDKEAVKRIADFGQLGMKPTRGQVTRDPLQFSTERNLAKMEVGQPLARRFDEQNKQLIENLSVARTAARSPAVDDYDAGQRIIKALQETDDQIKVGVDKLYTAARDEIGRAAPLDTKTFSEAANLKLDEGMLGHYVPPEIRNILNDVSSGKIPLNVDTMVRIDQVLSKAQRAAGDSPQSVAIGKIREALHDTPVQSEVGEEAIKAFDMARQAARKRFERIESIPALADLLKNKAVPPEDFVNAYVIRGSVDDVKKLMTELPPGARRDVRGAVIDWLKRQAVSGVDETATFSQAAYNKALDKIGERNLKSIFSDDPHIMGQLRRIGRVAANVQKAPVSAGVNYSSSATALMDMLDRFGNMPGVGFILGKPGDIAKATAVSKALIPAAPTAQPKPFLTMEAIDAAKRASGMVAAPAASGLVLGQ